MLQMLLCGFFTVAQPAGLANLLRHSSMRCEAGSAEPLLLLAVNRVA